MANHSISILLIQRQVHPRESYWGFFSVSLLSVTSHLHRVREVLLGGGDV